MVPYLPVTLLFQDQLTDFCHLQRPQFFQELEQLHNVELKIITQ